MERGGKASPAGAYPGSRPQCFLGYNTMNSHGPHVSPPSPGHLVPLDFIWQGLCVVVEISGNRGKVLADEINALAPSTQSMAGDLASACWRYRVSGPLQTFRICISAESPEVCCSSSFETTGPG